MKKCTYNDECNKKAIFGIHGTKKAEFCKIHKKENMIDVISKRCETQNCSKLPCFGFVGEKVKFCKEHKLENMINIKNKCLNKECTKIRIFGVAGTK